MCRACKDIHKYINDMVLENKEMTRKGWKMVRQLHNGWETVTKKNNKIVAKWS